MSEEVEERELNSYCPMMQVKVILPALREIAEMIK